MNMRTHTEKGRLSILHVLFLAVLIAFAASLIIPNRVHADQKKNTVKINQFETKQLKLMVADAPKVDWSSSDIKVCVVNNSGLIQAVGGGKCTITASVAGQNYNWTVTVTPLKLNKTSLYLLRYREGETLSVNLKKIRNQVSWVSSNSAVATVSSTGYVTPVAPGSAVITAEYSNITLACSVQVSDVTPSTLRKYRSPKNSANQRKVVLAGSSLMNHWQSVFSAFGSTTVINNAVSKSYLSNWNKWYKKLITDYKPKAVVICLGSSDIGYGNQMTAEQAAASMQKIIEKIHKKSKKTKVFFCSAPMFPARQTGWEATNSYNSLMKTYCGKKKYVTYLDLCGALAVGGVPNSSLYHNENTYLTQAGYDAMKKVVVKKVRKAAK